MTASDTAITRCVQACAAAGDGRGRWRVERQCAATLEAAGTSRPIATSTAAAAARLGAWIAQRAGALMQGGRP